MIKLIIEIAIVQTLFYYFFKFLLNIPIIGLFTLLKKDLLGMQISKFFQAIIFASLIAKIVSNNSTSTGILIFYSIIGFIMLFLNIIMGTIQTQRKILEIYSSYSSLTESEQKIILDSQNNIFYWLTSCLTFIITIIFPVIGNHPVNTFFIYIMNWLLDDTILRYVIIIVAVSLILSYLWTIFSFYIMHRLMNSNQDDNN